MIPMLAALAVAASQPHPAGPAPIIDVHMHALAANDQGPPPMGMCTPIAEFPVWDQRKPYTEIFMDRFKHPACKNPVWSPTTDEALMQQTIAVMKRRNIYGVLSGTPERVAQWRKAAPGRFWAGITWGLQ